MQDQKLIQIPTHAQVSGIHALIIWNCPIWMLLRKKCKSKIHALLDQGVLMTENRFVMETATFNYASVSMLF